MCPIFSVVERADEFPVSVMYGHGRRKPLGRVPMTRDKGKHGFAIKLFAFESFGKIHTVDDMILRCLEVQHPQNGWVQVVGLNAGIIA